MIRTLIVDDEIPARRVMHQLLQAHSDIEVVAEANSVATALTALATHGADVIFLDIRLRGETGFDFLAAAPGPLPRVIFVTAYDKFAIRAFECNAIDYLLKPVEPDRLSLSLDRVRKGLSPSPPAMTSQDSVFVKDGRRVRLVPWLEVSSIQADGNYTHITLTDGGKLYVQRTLKMWASQAPDGFLLQIHRGTLVQKNAIKGIEMIGPKRRQLTLHNGESLEIGGNFWNAVKRSIGA